MSIPFVGDDALGHGRPTGYYHNAGDKYDIGAFEINVASPKYKLNPDYIKLEGHIKFN
jgi:hypothetical protein